MKPVMPSVYLRDSSASFARNNSFLSVNRFDNIRDVSPVDSRSRSPSVKRKANDNSYANAAKKTLASRFNRENSSRSAPACPPPPRIFVSQENLEIIELNTAKVASICEKLHDSILAIPEENPICPILREFCSIFHIHNENNKIFAEAFRKSLAEPASGAAGPAADKAAELSDSEMEGDTDPPSQMVSLGRLPRARTSLLDGQQRGRQQREQAAPNLRNDRSPHQDPAKQRFRDLLQEAEKSSVVFNLDMGRVPLINKVTMGIKATSALTAMAAAAEERPASNPSSDTVAAIDDALSVAEKISFFGSSTKSLSGNSKNSGAFCTIPVCYTFPSKDIRIKAEKVLRTRCKVNCSTPYPQALRGCIKTVLEDGKRARPDDFCSVNVDSSNLSFKVSWRARNSSTWSRFDKLIPIPECVIENPNKIFESPVPIFNLPTSFPVTMVAPPPLSPPPTRPVVVRAANGLLDTIDSSASGIPPP